MKIDSPDSPDKITEYDTISKRKRLKDNKIKGLVSVQIRKNRIHCSHHKDDDSCVHIQYALNNDPGFVKTAIMNNVINPILEQINSKNK